MKGHHGGTRNAIGNVSAPWALIPFLAAAFIRPRRAIFGPFIGALSTVAALASYSLVRAARSGSPHRYAEMSLTSMDNRWFLLGIFGGAVLGALGALLAERRKWAAIGMLTASLLVLEPVARIIWALVMGEPPRTLIPSPGVWALEVLCGGVGLFAFHVCFARAHHALNRE